VGLGEVESEKRGSENITNDQVHAPPIKQEKKPSDWGTGKKGRKWFEAGRVELRLVQIHGRVEGSY